MRILVTGQSGLDKGEFIGKLRRLCNKKDRDGCDPDVVLDEGELKKSHIDRFVDLEKEFQRISHAKNYLDMNEGQFIDGKSAILQRLAKTDKSKNIVVGMHLTYFRKKSFYHRLDWNSLRQLDPQMVVTLIDDAYSIYTRIKKRKDPDDYVRSVTLKDVMMWRESEIMMSRTVADNLIPNRKIPHYLVAVAHQHQLLYQLIFEGKKKKRVYASFPITAAKSDKDLTAHTETFRKTLRRHFIVFDPYTIQEKLLHDAVVRQLGGLVPSASGSMEINKEEYRIEDLLPVLPDITGQVISRDERLIASADAVIAYRPALSEGVRYELDYAMGLGKRLIAYHPKDDGASPFAERTGLVLGDFDKFIGAIETFAKT